MAQNTNQVFYDENQICFMSYHAFFDMNGNDESITEVKVIMDGNRPIFYCKFRGNQEVHTSIRVKPTEKIIECIFTFTKHLKSSLWFQKVFLLGNHPNPNQFLEMDLPMSMINEMTKGGIKIEQWEYFVTDNYLHVIIPDVPEYILSMSLDADGDNVVLINEDMDVSCPNKKYIPNKIYHENITDPEDIQKIRNFEKRQLVEQFDQEKDLSFIDVAAKSKISTEVILKFTSTCLYHPAKYGGHLEADLIDRYEKQGYGFSRWADRFG